MKHKERPTATLILCVIIGAVIFSEFTPAAYSERRRHPIPSEGAT